MTVWKAGSIQSCMHDNKMLPFFLESSVTIDKQQLHSYHTMYLQIASPIGTNNHVVYKIPLATYWYQ